jgi:outer membrane protein TolC
MVRFSLFTVWRASLVACGLILTSASLSEATQPKRVVSCVSEVPWFNRCPALRTDSIRKNILGLRESSQPLPYDEVVTGSIRTTQDVLTFPLPRDRKAAPFSTARADPSALDDKTPKPAADRAPFQTLVEERPKPQPPPKRPPPLRRHSEPAGVAMNFAQAVRATLSDNPLVAASIAVTREAKANITIARSPLLPALDMNAATGQNVSGNYGTAVQQPYVDLTKAYGRWAVEGAIGGRQLLYDFNASQEQVTRAKFNWRAMNAREIATIEDVTQSVATAYLKVQETRDLLLLATDNVAAIQEILELLVESQRNGNATMADVARVRGRLVEAEALRADQDFGQKIAADRFRILVQQPPGPLTAFPDFSKTIPQDRVKAIELMVRNNPRMIAVNEQISAAEAEIRSLHGQNKPRIDAQLDAIGRNYRGYLTNSQIETRAMVNLSYKILDGGKNRGETEAAYARLEQEYMRYRDQKDNLELDLRQALWTLESTRGKSLALQEGLADNREARRLYTEQFKGGKRTLLELLEVQSAYFQSTLAVTQNQYEQKRAIVQILRVLGLLSKTVFPNG